MSSSTRTPATTPAMTKPRAKANSKAPIPISSATGAKRKKAAPPAVVSMPASVRATYAGFPVEDVSLALLKPHPRNYMQHPEDEIIHLMESIKEHGLYRPFVVANDNTLLIGHGVWKAAQRLHFEVGPVIRKPYPPEDPRALKLLIGDNEIRHLAEPDDRALTEMLKELSSLDQLMGTGFDQMMVASLTMVTRPSSEIADLNAAAQWVGMPAYDEIGQEPLQIIVNFLNEEDRIAFCGRLGLEASAIPTKGHGRSIWWPKQAWNDNTSLRFTDSAQDAKR